MSTMYADVALLTFVSSYPPSLYSIVCVFATSPCQRSTSQESPSLPHSSLPPLRVHWTFSGPCAARLDSFPFPSGVSKTMHRVCLRFETLLVRCMRCPIGVE